MLLACGMSKNQTAANIGQAVILEVRISLSSSGCENKIDLVTQNEIKEHFLKWCGSAGCQSPSSSATASEWLHSKSLHRTRLTQVLPVPFTFLLTILAVKILNFVVISHCSAEVTHIPKRAICQEDGINIRQYVFISGVLCQSIAVAPCRDLRKSVSHTVLLLLSLLNKTNQRCSFSWVQRHWGKGCVQMFSLLLQRNVKCVFCKTLSVWAKHLGCLEEVQ